MKRRTEIAVTIGLGLATASLLHDGVYLRYVRPAMFPVLAVAAAALVVIGIVSLFQPPPGPERDSRSQVSPQWADHGHHPEHRHGKVGWLLVIPILAALIPPPALGASSIGRIAALTLSSGDYTQSLRPGVPVLTLSEFATRATYGSTLTGRDVILEGFSTPSPSGGWNLSRLVIFCCAADAQVIQVRVTGLSDPGTSTWVRVTGRWQTGKTQVPTIQAVQLTPTAQPSNPYE